MRSDDLSILVLNEKIDLLKSELSENRLYLELCFVALLILVFGYFKSEFGKQTIASNSSFGLIMVIITIALYIGVIYFFYSVIRINNKNKKLINEKIDYLTKDTHKPVKHE